MTVLGVIPARGGSKGVPGKNLREVAGKPLIAYTIDAARASRRLNRLVLSTDDAAIADAGRTLGVEVPFMRPAELASDDAPMLVVLQHAMNEMAARGCAADTVVLLQPTSPLRLSSHIDTAVDLLASTGADSVVSVVSVPHQFSPASLMRLDGGRLRPLSDGPLVLQRQRTQPVYARNGPAVLAVRAEVLARGALYGDDTRALVMAPEESLDVDEPWDLELLEFVLWRRATPHGR
jgi:CMP-N,N'-diacetyllegionaminic acid synthase